MEAEINKCEKKYDFTKKIMNCLTVNVKTKSEISNDKLTHRRIFQLINKDYHCQHIFKNIFIGVHMEIKNTLNSTSLGF